ncbi:MAG TPA: FHA domain-containing protein [Thermoanaerobaculia bacterium]|nr:FHA domain-containing protein [Thermoanaerobaculia bacterium]
MSVQRPNLAREIIFAIGDNMRDGLEPLLTKTLAPSLYQVYLHADDYDRLRTIFREIEAEAKTYLDRELESLNRKAAPVAQRVRGKLPRQLAERIPAEEAATPPMRHVPASGEWHIRFQEDPNESLEPGEIEVVSELAVEEEAGYAAGHPTQRISVSTTRRLGRSESSRVRQALDAQPSASAAGSARGYAAHEAPTAPVPPAAPGHAFLEYKVDGGAVKRFDLDKDETFVGRGAVDVWVDLRLDTVPDVSRKHARIRCESTSGRYFVQDLSQFGTKVDGRAVPRAGELELRDGSGIELAGAVTLTFRQEAG